MLTRIRAATVVTATLLALGALATPASAAPVAPTITAVTDPVNQSHVTAVSVSGNAAAAGLDVTVRVSAGGATVTGTSPSGAGGDYTVSGLDVSSLGDGTLTVIASSADPGGQVGPDSTATTTTKDTVSPTKTSATPTAGSTLRPPSSVAFVFSEPLGTATVAIPGVPGSTVVSGSTATFTPTGTIPDGARTATATVTDVHGNPGSGSTSFTVDGTAPTVMGLAATATTVSAPSSTVTGTRSESSTVAIVASDGTHTVTTSVAGGTGAFSKTLSLATLDDGPIAVRATPTDTVGNVGAMASVTTSKDATAPDVSSLAGTRATIASPSTTVTGTRSETVTVQLSATDGTHTVSRTLPSRVGAFSTTLDLSSFVDGPVTLTATPTDTAGNVGGATTAATSKDSVAPVVTGVAATRTHVTAQSTSVTGHRSESASLAITASDGTHTVNATVALGSGDFARSVDLSALDDGTVTVKVTPTDAAGNVGATVTVTTTRDTTLPVLTGVAATRTSIATPSSTVTGTRSEAATVLLVATDSTSQSVSLTVASGTGAFSKLANLSSLADGTITLTATPTDTAGNVGATTSITTTKDATKPVVSGLAATATTTTSQLTTVTGTRSESASVAVVATDGTHTSSATVGSGSGGFSVLLDLTNLDDGTVTVTATPTDLAGNTGAVASTTAHRDAHNPVVTGLAATSTSTSLTSTTVRGTRSETATVAISVTDGTHTVTAAVPSGSGAFTTTVDLATLVDGPVTVTATPTDTAGNVGAAATATTVKDTVGPTVGHLAATRSSAGTPASKVTGTRSESSKVSLSATDGTHTVTALVPAGTGPFTASLDLSGFTPGTVTVTATATDTVGNVGPAATTTTTRDVTLPATTITLDGLPAKITAGQTITLSGRVTRKNAEGSFGNLTLKVTQDSGRVTAFRTVTPSSTGAFSVTIRPTSDGSYTASYAGDAANAPATSPARRNLVSFRVTAQSPQGPVAKPVPVTGRVSPPRGGATVKLFRVLAGGKLVQLAATTMDVDGRFAFKVPLSRGRTRLEVYVRAVSGNAAGMVRLTATRT